MVWELAKCIDVIMSYAQVSSSIAMTTQSASSCLPSRLRFTCLLHQCIVIVFPLKAVGSLKNDRLWVDPQMLVEFLPSLSFILFTSCCA